MTLSAYPARRDPEPSEPGIDEPALAALVDDFYGRVRADPLIGPVFMSAVEDWPAHLEKLAAFWSSVMLTTGRYKGNPLAAHMKHALDPAMFERWLRLWAETTEARFDPPAAASLQARARRIAESLQLALFFRPGEAVAAPRPRRTVAFAPGAEA